MSIKHALLGLLGERPLHGYELRAAYERELVPRGTLNVGQVYTTLERLERDGLVQATRMAQDVRPDKKVYALTDAGRAELKGWLRRASLPDLELRNETFVKLMVARRLEGEDPLEVVAIERQACFERLHEILLARTHAGREGEPLAVVLLLELAALKLEGMVTWLDRCESALRKESGS